jgi:hypothetical protein
MKPFCVRPWIIGLLAGLLIACEGAATDSDDESARESVQEEDLGIRLRAEIHGPTDIRFTLTGAEAPDSASPSRGPRRPTRLPPTA